MIWVFQGQNECYTNSVKVLAQLILFENQIQTTSALPCRTQVQPAASFLVCSLIFIEYKIQIYTNTSVKKRVSIEIRFF